MPLHRADLLAAWPPHPGMSVLARLRELEQKTVLCRQIAPTSSREPRRERISSQPVTWRVLITVAHAGTVIAETIAPALAVDRDQAGRHLARMARAGLLLSWRMVARGGGRPSLAYTISPEGFRLVRVAAKDGHLPEDACDAPYEPVRDLPGLLAAPVRGQLTEHAHDRAPHAVLHDLGAAAWIQATLDALRGEPRVSVAWHGARSAVARLWVPETRRMKEALGLDWLEELGEDGFQVFGLQRTWSPIESDGVLAVQLGSGADDWADPGEQRPRPPVAAWVHVEYDRTDRPDKLIDKILRYEPWLLAPPYVPAAQCRMARCLLLVTRTRDIAVKVAERADRVLTSSMRNTRYGFTDPPHYQTRRRVFIVDEERIYRGDTKLLGVAPDPPAVPAERHEESARFVAHANLARAVAWAWPGNPGPAGDPHAADVLLRRDPIEAHRSAMAARIAAAASDGGPASGGATERG